jgi:hypothetical protein
MMACTRASWDRTEPVFAEVVLAGGVQELVQLSAQPDQVIERGRVDVPGHDRGT